MVVHASIRPATPTAVSQTGLGISDHHRRFASEIRYLSVFIETAHVGVVYWSEHGVSEWVSEGVKSCEKDADREWGRWTVLNKVSLLNARLRED